LPKGLVLLHFGSPFLHFESREDTIIILEENKEALLKSFVSDAHIRYVTTFDLLPLYLYCIESNSNFTKPYVIYLGMLHNSVAIYQGGVLRQP